MIRDEHHISGRLAPPRPDYGWETPSPDSPRQFRRAVLRHPAWREDYDEPSLPEEVLEEGDPNTDSQYSEEEDAYLSASRVTDGRGAGGPRDYGYSEPLPAGTQAEAYHYSTTEPVETETTITAYPDYQEPIARRGWVESLPDPLGLSIQERHQLLMRTVELYDDEWKLAGIRANEKKSRLEAYLTPRSKRIELREAISKNQVLIIMIDCQGNTDVREPKRQGPWRRLTTWLFGS